MERCFLQGSLRKTNLHLNSEFFVNSEAKKRILGLVEILFDYSIFFLPIILSSILFSGYSIYPSTRDSQFPRLLSNT